LTAEISALLNSSLKLFDVQFSEFTRSPDVTSFKVVKEDFPYQGQLSPYKLPIKVLPP